MKPTMILAAVLFLFILGCGADTVGPTEAGTQCRVQATPVATVEMYVDVPAWVTDATTWGEICGSDSAFAEAVADLLALSPDEIDVNTSWTEIKELFRPCDNGGNGGDSPPDGGGSPGDPPNG